MCGVLKYVSQKLLETAASTGRARSLYEVHMYLISNEPLEQGLCNSCMGINEAWDWSARKI